jgi:N-acetylmuramic acid 6-phosphate (MurNAc-6-P) etherase
VGDGHEDCPGLSFDSRGTERAAFTGGSFLMRAGTMHALTAFLISTFQLIAVGHVSNLWY